MYASRASQLRPLINSHLVADARKLSDKIKKKGGSELRSVSTNLIDAVWGRAKPSRPSNKVTLHPVEYAGKKFEDKLEDLRKELEKRKSAGFVVCMDTLPPVF